MSSQLSDARAILDAAGYRTYNVTDVGRLIFEGQTLLGSVHFLASIAEVFEKWEALQDAFLKENAERLRFDRLKAWNCYTVFLCEASSSQAQSSELSAIEENFRGTRKIVRTGVRARTDVEGALAPLLPLRNLLQFTQEDVKEKLSSRLGESDSPLHGLLNDAPVATIASHLIGDA